MEVRNKVFFFSPHFDDAIFSCGGKILNHIKNGDKVVVITVFSAIPSEDCFSDFSAKIASSNLFQKRKQENSDILKSLNAEVINLDFLDAIFRKNDLGEHLCLSWSDVFSADRKKYREEKKLLTSLQRELNEVLQKKPQKTYFPLSLGGHVDHVLLNKITEELNFDKHDLEIVYYEDLPYANSQSGQNNWLEKKYNKETEEIDIEKKIDLVLAYKNSLEIGGQSSSTIDIIKEYASKISKEFAYSERYWSRKK